MGMRDKAKFRDYMRDYMRRRRGPVDAVAGRSLLPGPVVGPVGRVDVLPAPAPVPVPVVDDAAAGIKAGLGDTDRLRALLAAGRASVARPEVRPVNLPAMTRRDWHRLSEDRQRREVKRRGFKDEQDRDDWLETLEP